MRGALASWLWAFLCLQELKMTAEEAPLQILIISSLHVNVYVYIDVYVYVYAYAYPYVYISDSGG